MKFLKIIAMISVVVSLQGCYQVVNGYDIERAINKCGSLQEVQEIAATFDGNEKVMCKDRSKNGHV